MPRTKKEAAVAIGKRMCAARESLGLLQADVARELGVSLESYGGYERGYTMIPTELLPDVATILRCSVHYLLGLPDPCDLDPSEDRIITILRSFSDQGQRDAAARTAITMLEAQLALDRTTRAHTERRASA